MTFSDLSKRYQGLYISTDSKKRAMAKGFLDLIQLYKETESDELSDDVRISLLAEDYKKKQEDLYRITKKPEYKFKILAATECIIDYYSTEDIIKFMNGFNSDDKSLANYIKYMKGVGVMNKIKIDDLKNVYDLLNLYYIF